MKTYNKLVAVEPFPTKTIQRTVMKGGLIGVAQKVELTGLKVVLESDCCRFRPGMTVWVRGDLAAQDFANNIQNINGKQFILLSDSYIQVAE